MKVSHAAFRLATASVAVMLSLATPASAQTEQPPKAGGTLNMGIVYITLSALSWDPADWTWKHNQDTGNYEQLFAADLTKSKRNGGKHVQADAWLPTDGIRGELAESWAVEEEPAARRGQAAQGRHVPRQARGDEVARVGCRGRGLQLQPAGQEPEEESRLTSTTSRRSRRPTSTRCVFTSRSTTPSGTTASAGATTRASCPRKSPTPAPRTGRSQRHRPVPADRLRAGQRGHLHEEPGLLGQGDDRRASTSCRSSTRSSTA